MPEQEITSPQILKINGMDEGTRTMLKALASEPRLRILEILAHRLMNVSEIAEALEIPLSTTVMHVNILKKAGLLRTEVRPGERGLQKVCQRVYDTVLLELPTGPKPAEQEMIEVAMPIGSFVECDVIPTCGLATTKSVVGMRDDPTSFFEPARMDAQLIWFHSGSLTYRFPNRLPEGALLDSVWLSLELCSEAPMYHPDWPSDITVWINDAEVGTWTSPADFGGQRGLLTPAWWDARNSQYGLLKEWRVDRHGSFVDGARISKVTVDDLDVQTGHYISVRIGVKSEASHVGGVNIFGRKFGNYPQDIVMRLRFH